MNLSPNALARKAIHRASHAILPRHETKVVQAQICGFKLLVLANEDVGREITYLGKYEPKDSSFLASLVQSGDVCFDIGANTGYYTMLLAHRALRGEVHAFEPVAFNWHLLSCNVMLNDLSNVRVNHCALSNVAGVADFSQSSDGAYSSLIAVGRRPEAQRVQVTVDTLSEYLERRAISRVDVIKLDVEGAEKLVIEGGRELFLDPARRPRVVMIELYDENLRPYGTSVDDMVRIMGEFGYKAYCISPRDGNPMTFEARQYNLIYNVFFACDTQTIKVAGETTSGVGAT